MISRRKILTCTHVVEAALRSLPASPRGEQITAVFVGLPDQPACLLNITAVRYPPDPESRPHSDICVLELAETERDFPRDFCIVRPCHEALALKASLFGYAMKQDLVGGHPIRGIREDSLVEHRQTLVSEQPDLVAREGASGTPLFVEGKGMVGLATAAQDRQTLFYIPVAVLARFVAELEGSTGSAESIAFQPPDGGRQLDQQKVLRLRLGENLHRLDREPQWTVFRQRFAGDPGSTRKGFVCVIAGQVEDLPTYCRTKIEKSISFPADRAEQLRGSGANSELMARELIWPKVRNLDVKRAVQALVRGLHPDLSAVKAPFDMDMIRATLNLDLCPRFYSNVVDPDYFDHTHHALLQAWLDFLDALNQKPLSLAFVHFLIFQFREPPGRVGDGASSVEWVEKRLDSLLAQSANPGFFGRLFRSRAAPAAAGEDREALHRLPTLAPIERDHITRWIGEVAGDFGGRLDDDTIQLVKQHFTEEFDDSPEVCLKRIEKRSRI